MSLKYTLVTDGSSDKALLRVIDWLLPQHGCSNSTGSWADLRISPRQPANLSERLQEALWYYPCDVLFVHRDAEGQSLSNRLREIQEALEEGDLGVDAVCVVPVRMTEAWLLHDEEAIRRAAGNPNGTIPLDLPPLTSLEGLPDPKEVLKEALLRATEFLGGRRRQRAKRELGLMRLRVAQLIEDFSPLRQLPAFNFLEENCREVLSGLLGRELES